MSKLDELRAKNSPIQTGQENTALGREQQAEALGEGFVMFRQAAVLHNFETLPRSTLVRMLKEKAIDENFVFNVPRDTAYHYVGAMRAVLSRSRRKAEKRKQRLQDFKLLIISIEHTTDHDIVTLVRTQTKAQRVLSVYDEVLDSITLGVAK